MQRRQNLNTDGITGFARMNPLARSSYITTYRTECLRNV